MTESELTCARVKRIPSIFFLLLNMTEVHQTTFKRTFYFKTLFKDNKYEIRCSLIVYRIFISFFLFCSLFGFVISHMWRHIQVNLGP